MFAVRCDQCAAGLIPGSNLFPAKYSAKSFRLVSSSSTSIHFSTSGEKQTRRGFLTGSGSTREKHAPQHAQTHARHEQGLTVSQGRSCSGTPAVAVPAVFAHPQLVWCSFSSPYRRAVREEPSYQTSTLPVACEQRRRCRCWRCWRCCCRCCWPPPLACLPRPCCPCGCAPSSAPVDRCARCALAALCVCRVEGSACGAGARSKWKSGGE